jgi:hypothetical protein
MISPSSRDESTPRAPVDIPNSRLGAAYTSELVEASREAATVLSRAAIVAVLLDEFQRTVDAIAEIMSAGRGERPATASDYRHQVLAQVRRHESSVVLRALGALLAASGFSATDEARESSSTRLVLCEPKDMTTVAKPSFTFASDLYDAFSAEVSFETVMDGTLVAAAQHYRDSADVRDEFDVTFRMLWSVGCAAWVLRLMQLREWYILHVVASSIFVSVVARGRLSGVRNGEDFFGMLTDASTSRFHWTDPEFITIRRARVPFGSVRPESERFTRVHLTLLGQLARRLAVEPCPSMCRHFLSKKADPPVGDAWSQALHAMTETHVLRWRELATNVVSTIAVLDVRVPVRCATPVSEELTAECPRADDAAGTSCTSVQEAPPALLVLSPYRHNPMRRFSAQSTETMKAKVEELVQNMKLLAAIRKR